MKNCNPKYFTLMLALVSSISWAQCSDYDAKAAADKASEKTMKGEIFKVGTVLKVHLPSKRKEIASYLKIGDLYYTVFSLVNDECHVQIIKRTHGKY